MVMSSTEAITLTTNAISFQTTLKVQQEVGLAERQIRNAASRQQFELLYNATLVKNPPSDPQVDESLTPEQIEFRDTFVDAGYYVTWDEDSGFWSISWDSTGAETLVTIYHIYTTLTPGAVENQTNTAIRTFFNNLTPTVRARSFLVNPSGSGGDVPETAFGASSSTFYTYVAVTQQSDDQDHSAGLLAALLATGLGYTDPNTEVYLVG